MWQEAEGLRKSLQNSDTYFLVQQQVLEYLSAKQEKVNNLAKHLASIMGTQDIVSWDLLSGFSSGLVLLRRLFALVANFDN